MRGTGSAPFHRRTTARSRTAGARCRRLQRCPPKPLPAFAQPLNLLVRIRRTNPARSHGRPGPGCRSRRYPALGSLPIATSAAATTYLSDGFDVNVVDVLLRFDCLANRLAEHTAKLSGCLVPLSTRESFRTNSQLACGRDCDDQLSHRDRPPA